MFFLHINKLFYLLVKNTKTKYKSKKHLKRKTALESV